MSDFSFIVIGDTGEGDASQHSLRDQYLQVVRTPEVKFVVISSDVVYPAGSMRDYEAKFWLPFMGTTKPVYAIPGNHDWYDALEGFTATFLQPTAARAAMRARVEADNRMTSTTDRRIEQLVAEASRLRKEYGVPTQLQECALLPVPDRLLRPLRGGYGGRPAPGPGTIGVAVRRTGVRTRQDEDGHPRTPALRRRPLPRWERPGFRRAAWAAPRARRRDRHGRRYSRPRVLRRATARLFDGDAPLRQRRRRRLPEFRDRAGLAGSAGDCRVGVLSEHSHVVAKIEATTPYWKWPAWWWTKRLGGWPFSAEWLSAAFDANVAPFYQSFIEVQVEPTNGLVRLRPYGVHGRLRWRDMEVSAGAVPSDAAPGSPVEWVVKMGQQR